MVVTTLIATKRDNDFVYPLDSEYRVPNAMYATIFTKLLIISILIKPFWYDFILS